MGLKFFKKFTTYLTLLSFVAPHVTYGAFPCWPGKSSSEDMIEKGIPLLPKAASYQDLEQASGDALAELIERQGISIQDLEDNLSADPEIKDYLKTIDEKLYPKRNILKTGLTWGFALVIGGISVNATGEILTGSPAIAYLMNLTNDSESQAAGAMITVLSATPEILGLQKEFSDLPEEIEKVRKSLSKQKGIHLNSHPIKRLLVKVAIVGLAVFLTVKRAKLFKETSIDQHGIDGLPRNNYRLFGSSIAPVCIAEFFKDRRPVETLATGVLDTLDEGKTPADISGKLKDSRFEKLQRLGQAIDDKLEDEDHPLAQIHRDEIREEFSNAYRKIRHMPLEDLLDTADYIASLNRNAQTEEHRQIAMMATLNYFYNLDRSHEYAVGDLQEPKSYKASKIAGALYGTVIGGIGGVAGACKIFGVGGLGITAAVLLGGYTIAAMSTSMSLKFKSLYSRITSYDHNERAKVVEQHLQSQSKARLAAEILGYGASCYVSLVSAILPVEQLYTWWNLSHSPDVRAAYRAVTAFMASGYGAIQDKVFGPQFQKIISILDNIKKGGTCTKDMEGELRDTLCQYVVLISNSFKVKNELIDKLADTLHALREKMDQSTPAPTYQPPVAHPTGGGETPPKQGSVDTVSLSSAPAPIMAPLPEVALNPDGSFEPVVQADLTGDYVPLLEEPDSHQALPSFAEGVDEGIEPALPPVSSMQVVNTALLEGAGPVVVIEQPSAPEGMMGRVHVQPVDSAPSSAMDPMTVSTGMMTPVPVQPMALSPQQLAATAQDVPGILVETLRSTSQPTSVVHPQKGPAQGIIRSSLDRIKSAAQAVASSPVSLQKRLTNWFLDSDRRNLGLWNV